MVMRGVFGLEDDGAVRPKLPVSLVPMLFGQRDTIRLDLGDRVIVLRRPARLGGNLLEAGRVHHHGDTTEVQLVARSVKSPPLRMNAPFYLPATPQPPKVVAAGRQWSVTAAVPGVLYVNGHRHGRIDSKVRVARADGLQCFSVTALGADGMQSLHSRETCVGQTARVHGAWPRRWTAPRSGTYLAWLRYDNDHGPINTGITAAVKRMHIACGASPVQVLPIVMPQSDGVQDSTRLRFTARAGQTCRFALEQGFNMSNLAHFVHFTGGQGGATGPLNQADVRGLHIAPLPAHGGQ